MFSDSVNWALHKPAWQSTTFVHDSIPLVATIAVDGKISSFQTTTDACAHTETGSAGALFWWAVDLGKSIRVSRVVIYGSTDGWGMYNIYSSINVVQIIAVISKLDQEIII